jgi:hypothetical protein
MYCLCTAGLCVLQLTHDGRWLTTTDGNTVRVWDVANLSAPVKTFTVPYPLEAASYCPAKVRGTVQAVQQWEPGGLFVLAVEHDVVLWNMTLHTMVCQWACGTPQPGSTTRHEGSGEMPR